MLYLHRQPVARRAPRAVSEVLAQVFPGNPTEFGQGGDRPIGLLREFGPILDLH